MRKVGFRDLGIIAGGLTFLGWAVWPPSALTLTEACGPGGGPAAISAALFPGTFWRKQLSAVVLERNDLLSRPARRARIDAQIRAESSAIEGRMERLSHEQGQPTDQEEKERRDQEEQSARLKRVAWLMACEGDIRQRLAE